MTKRYKNSRYSEKWSFYYVADTESISQTYYTTSYDIDLFRRDQRGIKEELGIDWIEMDESNIWPISFNLIIDKIVVAVVSLNEDVDI